MKRKRLETAEEEGSSAKHESKILTPSSPLLDLPNEMIIQILSNLDHRVLVKTVSLVCRRLRDLSQHSSLWTSVVLPRSWHKDAKTTAKNKSLLTRNSTHLEILDLNHRKDSATLAAHALKCCPRLKEVDNYHVSNSASNMVFLRLVKDADSLKRATIHGNCSVRLFVKQAACLRNLTDIVLNGFHFTRSDSGLLRSLARHCKNLKSLLCDHRRSRIEDEEMNFFLDQVKSTLSALVLSVDAMTDVSFGNLGSCSSLRRLRLLNADQLGALGFHSITGLPKLEELALMGCHNLEDLDIMRSLTDHKMGNLSQLDVFHLEGLRNSGLAAIADSCPALKRMFLFLTGGKVTGTGIKTVAEKCRLLTVLQLVGVSGVTAATFEKGTTKLKELMLHQDRGSYELDGPERDKLWKLMPSLRLLSLGRRKGQKYARK